MDIESDKDMTTIILVVEDEVAIRMGLSAALSRLGYRIVTAENGSDGLLKAEQYHPDLIISDVLMPVLDGFAMKNKLNENPALAPIPLIYLTARTALEDRVMGLNGGGDDYVTKPFDVIELTARVNAVLRRIHAERKRGRELARQFDEADLEKLHRELMQNFHHELRTPLNNVLMFLEIVATHKFDTLEEQKEFVRIARSSGERLESLISDIILLTDLDQGSVNNLRQPINPESHILQPVRRRLTRYESKSLVFVPIFSINGQIQAPREEFTKSVVHLADNAFKFSPPEGTVILKVTSGVAGGVTITVEDQGTGIPTDLHEKVFERYFQSSRGIARESQGLGVGLTLVRAVFRSLGGDVKIHETPQGCCVEAVLPDVPVEKASP